MSSKGEPLARYRNASGVPVEYTSTAMATLRQFNKRWKSGRWKMIASNDVFPLRIEMIDDQVCEEYTQKLSELATGPVFTATGTFFDDEVEDERNNS